MFCPNCGAQLPDGSRFCANCGTKLEVTVNQQADIPVQPSDTLKQPEYDHFAAGEKLAPKKKKYVLIAAAAVVALALVAGAGFFVKTLFFGGDRQDQAYIYLADEKYELVTNIKKAEAEELASLRTDYAQPGFLKFSSDGKYVYYLSKFNEDLYTGTLCRAEYEKIKRSPSKKDKYIETIATNVNLGFELFDNNTVIYTNGNDALYCYDGKTSEQIAKNVYSFDIDSKSKTRLLYTVRDADAGSDIYAVSLDDISKKTKLASNCINMNYENFDHIFYLKEDGDDSYSLYVVGFNSEPQKLGSRAEVLTGSDGTVYFTEENGEVLNLYDYVTDEMAEADASTKEPSKEDYAVQRYAYYSLDEDSDISIYGEIFTSCTQTTYLYRDDDGYQSLQYASENEPDEAKRAAYKAFVDKYKAQEAADGYLVVTEDVKNDLIALAAACVEPEDEDDEEKNKWLELCFYRDPDGFDYSGYDEAMMAYSEVEVRNDVRAILKASENAVPLKNLYCYSNGTKTLISDKVINTESYNGVVMYNTAELVTERMALEDVYMVEDILPMFAISDEKANPVILSGQTSPVTMSEKALPIWSDAYYDGYAYLYAYDSHLFLRTPEDELYEAVISGNSITEFTLIAEDARLLNYDQGTLYYSVEKSVDSYYYCDVYSYKDKKSTCIAQDILLENASLYADGTLLGMTGYADELGYELTVFAPDGTKTLLADSVSHYVRVDAKTLFYISDNELYLYNGKEKELIASDVQWFWSKNRMERLGAFDGYYYMDMEY